jgi:transposase
MAFPPSLDELLPPDHPARFIHEFVMQIDLERYGISKPSSEQGGKFYNPQILMKIWLYGMYENVNTNRKLERMCYNDLGMLWLTGFNYPDHNTIWRFWSNHKAVIGFLFKDTVAVALNMGLVGLTLNAVDGTKILSRGSSKGVLSRQELEEILVELDTIIARMTSEIDSSLEDDAEPSYKLPEQLKEKQELRAKIKQSLDFLDEINRDYTHSTDPDSRLIRGPDNRCKPSYNVQAAADEENSIILAADVVQDETDNNMLVPMLDQVKENTGKVADNTVADGGYFSGEQLSEADSKGYSVLVNMTGGESYTQASDKYSKDMFEYDDEHKSVICPHGHRLEFQRLVDNSRGTYKYRQYRCTAFKDCPYRHLCSNAKNGRTIKIHPQEKILRKQRLKQKNQQAQEKLNKRKTIIEPIFGVIKHNRGFRQFSCFGLANAKAQWYMICAVYNLRKIYQHWILSCKNRYKFPSLIGSIQKFVQYCTPNKLLSKNNLIDNISGLKM